MLLVLGSNQLAKAPVKRSHSVVLTTTDSPSEGLQRFIKQFLLRKSAKGAYSAGPPWEGSRKAHRGPGGNSGASEVPTNRQGDDLVGKAVAPEGRPRPLTQPPAAPCAAVELATLPIAPGLRETLTRAPSTSHPKPTLIVASAKLQCIAPLHNPTKPPKLKQVPLLLWVHRPAVLR
jgi:hypothetical protein